ncbi:MAG: aminotransferase class IV [Candidatus Thalassarchaeaceae archaeon]|nr:aminotransferase class IV [Candidatus Thalassarchaeaceae archaeon]
MIEQARTSVFTTMRWDGKYSVAHFSKHIERLENHSLRLEIPWPTNSESLATNALFQAFNDSTSSVSQEEVGLVRLRLTSMGEMRASTRWKGPIKLATDNSSTILQVAATALPAPQWNETIDGCKHGDWQPYHDAKKVIDERGCEIALFIKDDAVIDCLSSTPLLLDDDGVAWYPDPTNGAVDSISIATIIPFLIECGIPVSQGRLTRSLLARGRALLAIGTGIGVAHITHLDGQEIGDGSTEFATLCAELFHTAINESWFKAKGVGN